MVSNAEYIAITELEEFLLKRAELSSKITGLIETFAKGEHIALQSDPSLSVDEMVDDITYGHFEFLENNVREAV